MDRVFGLVKLIFMHFWPQDQSPVSSHGNIQNLFKELRVEPDLVDLYRTFNKLLSFADPDALTQYRNERSGVEKDMWDNAIQGAIGQDDSLDVMLGVIGSGLEHASYDIFLDFYSSCAQNRSGGLLRGIPSHLPAGVQCM